MLAVAVGGETGLGGAEAVLAVGDDEEDATGDRTADDLGDPVGDDRCPLDTLRDSTAEGDGGVEVSAGDVADRVGAGDDGEAEGQRDTDEADAHVDGAVGDDLGGEDCGAAAAEDEPEGAEELGPESVGHGNGGHGVTPVVEVSDVTYDTPTIAAFGAEHNTSSRNTDPLPAGNTGNGAFTFTAQTHKDRSVDSVVSDTRQRLSRICMASG